MELSIKDIVGSKRRKDIGVVIGKTKNTITIKWSRSTEKITFHDKLWNWIDYDYEKI